jgi:uncharacterized protein (DUF885 family)
MNQLTRRDLFAAGLALGIAPIARNLLAQAPPAPSRRTIDDFFRDVTADWVRHDPSLATSTRYFTGDEQDRLARQLTPRTLEWRRDRIQRARQGLVELRRFDRSRMTDLQRVSADVMGWQLDTLAREEPYLDNTFPLEQMNGTNVALVETLTVRYPLLTERDAENYVAALGQVGARMGEAVDDASRLESKNIIPPRFILAATIKQMQAFVDIAPGQNPFVAAFVDRMSAIKPMSDGRREQLRAEAEKVVAAQIYPAWKKGIALLQALGTHATNDAGLWRFKGGADIYADALARFTTTKLTANEIHELGLAQVKRIETEMDGLLRRLGRTDGSVKDRIERLKLDLQYPNPTSDDSRAQIMRDIDGIIRDAERRAALLFDLRPKSPVVAQPFPRFREANAAANYNAPSVDGSRPGTFQFPRRIENMTRFGLRSVVYHETVPGHHFQIALQVESKDLPRFLQVRAFGGISASSEGWGLYAERLAAESGWYGDDIEGRLGQLNYELFRARRLVVDTGLHAKKWTREQSIDYGIEASEVERYVVYAGQACSYMIGELKLIELRDKAKKALGDRFSLRDYHNTVLRTGTVPLDVLAREVDRYVSSIARRGQDI